MPLRSAAASGVPLATPRRSTSFPGRCTTALRLLVARAAAVSAACGGDGGSTDPEPTESVETLPPVRIATAQIVEGGGRTGVVGQILAQPLVALVADSAGKPLADRAVRFDMPANGGWTSVRDTTDATGRASVSWRLDTPAVVQRAYVQVYDSVARRVLRDSVTATAVAGPPARVGTAPATSAAACVRSASPQRCASPRSSSETSIGAR